MKGALLQTITDADFDPVSVALCPVLYKLGGGTSSPKINKMKFGRQKGGILSGIATGYILILNGNDINPLLLNMMGKWNLHLFPQTGMCQELT